MPIIVKDLNAYYNKDTVFETHALKNINFNIEDGEFVGLIGSTGSGKSTLIQHFNGLLKPYSGSVEIDGVIIDKQTKALAELRRKVGLVFQYPEYQLFEETVKKDIAFGPKNLGLSDQEIDLRVREAMALVELPFEQYAERSPFDLSGGEKRRIAIAGVLAMKPSVLMLDEPTAGLDPYTRKELLNQLKKLQEENQMTIIMVSHSMDEVAEVAGRIIALDKGEVAIDASIEEAFENPDRIEALGLDLPTTAKLFFELEKCGSHRQRHLLSIDEAKDALWKAVKHAT